MLPQAKLDALPIDTLTALRQQITDTINKKARLAIRPGVEATFVHNGETKRIMIERINHKTVGGYEIDSKTGMHLRMRKWRVGPTLLTPVPPRVKPTSAPLRTAGDVPAIAASW